MHKAISKSSAKYVVHGFDDDPPSNVARLVQECESTKSLWCSSKVTEIRYDKQDPVTYTGIPEDSLLNRNSVPLQGCVFRRKLLAEVGFLEPDTPFWCYDHDLVLRLYLNGHRHGYVDSVCGYWTINPLGITATPLANAQARVWQDRRSELWKKYRGEDISN